MTRTQHTQRVAIVHDWLTGMRGGEKCLEVFCELFPEATLFTLIHDKGSMSPVIEKMDIRTSFLQKVPGITRNYRKFLPLFPAAIESFDLSKYDLILSSSHCAAKGVKKNKNALHISYCYTPMRYAWKFFDEYFLKEGYLKRFLIKVLIDRVKKWDFSSNKRVDYFIAISDNIKNRIRESYSRNADVICPPVDTGLGPVSFTDKGYYLVVSALVPYKRVDLALEAFSKTGKRLLVVGDGDQKVYLERLYSGSNIKFLGWASDKELRGYYSGCKALIFPGEEDFGIVPLEAQLFGKPVIAYAKGGALETVIPFEKSKVAGAFPYPTGIYFYEQTEPSLNAAVEFFEKNIKVFDPVEIRKNAERFNRERFKQEIREYIDSKSHEHYRE